MPIGHRRMGPDPWVWTVAGGWPGWSLVTTLLVTMRVVNVKELKAKLSAYLREVERGEEFLVTDRGRVVARLARFETSTATAGASKQPDVLSRLAARGVRLPRRARRPTDYRRSGPGPGLTAEAIDELLAWAREDRS